MTLWSLDNSEASLTWYLRKLGVKIQSLVTHFLRCFGGAGVLKFLMHSLCKTAMLAGSRYMYKSYPTRFEFIRRRNLTWPSLARNIYVKGSVFSSTSRR
jgi:hypothetical protein